MSYTPGGGANSSSMGTSSDVALSNPLDNDTLAYDASTQKWTNTALQTAPVQSVAGRTGTVTLTKSDVGLSNVDNTSDATKPISTATQAALNAKAPTSTTMVVVNHGSSASTPRPTAPAVYWIGTVTPANMTSADIYNGPIA